MNYKNKALIKMFKYLSLLLAIIGLFVGVVFLLGKFIAIYTYIPIASTTDTFFEREQSNTPIVKVDNTGTTSPESTYEEFPTNYDECKYNPAAFVSDGQCVLQFHENSDKKNYDKCFEVVGSYVPTGGICGGGSGCTPANNKLCILNISKDDKYL